MTKALAFIFGRSSSLSLLDSTAICPNLHPSEDSEALQQISSNSPLEQAPISAGVGPVAEPADWFALYTTCRHEKRVALHLEQREIEHFLPLYTAHRKWRDGSRVALELPLFPCYLFVRAPRLQRAQVLSVPGALVMVGGTGGGPAPIDPSAIDALRDGLNKGILEPHPLLTIGQQVRICAGTFAGMTGIVARRKSGFRVVLTLQQIMQSIAVEVDENNLEIVEENQRSHGAFAPSRAFCLQHA